MSKPTFATSYLMFSENKGGLWLVVSRRFGNRRSYGVDERLMGE
jgi:hypothetical protein